MTSDDLDREARTSLFDGPHDNDDARDDERDDAPSQRPTAYPAGGADSVVYAPPALVPRVVGRWRPILALGLAAAVVAALVGLVSSTSYRAEALVQLGSGAADLVTGSAAPQDDLDRRIATESEIIGSGRVRAAAEDAVGRDLPPVEVAQESTSALLSVAVTAADPARAAEDADAYVDAYLQLDSAQTRDQLAPAIEISRNRLANLAGALADLQLILEDTPVTRIGTDPATDAVQARVDNLLEERTAVKENIDRLEGAAAIGNLEVRSFADAVPPSSPSSTPPLRLALLALLVGLVGGAIVAAAVPLGARRRPRA